METFFFYKTSSVLFPIWFFDLRTTQAQGSTQKDENNNNKLWLRVEIMLWSFLSKLKMKYDYIAMIRMKCLLFLFIFDIDVDLWPFCCTIGRYLVLFVSGAVTLTSILFFPFIKTILYTFVLIVIFSQ